MAIEDTRGFAWAAVAWGSCGFVGGLVCYALALSGLDMSPNSVSLRFGAGFLGVLAVFYWSEGKWTRPHPRPIVAVTRGRVLLAQICFYASSSLVAVHTVGSVFTADNPESPAFVLQASAGVFSMIMAMSVIVVAGFALCLHNVLFFVMPPDEPRE
jgi:hypothetical protein